jgi:hypothetical protein
VIGPIDPEYIAKLAELDRLVMAVDDDLIAPLAATIGAQRAEGVEEHQILKSVMSDLNDDEEIHRHILCLMLTLAIRRLPEAQPPTPERGIR